MKGVLIGWWLLVAGACKAQTTAEWLEQNKTRLKYYEQQIVTLQTYIGYAQKGYSIMESGLNTISEIKSGEFNLHNAFYNSLEAVNPSIGNMGEVLEIIALQAATVERCTISLSRYRQTTGLHEDEVTYIGNVYALVLSEGISDISTLIDIITADKLKMTDDQRIARIGELDRSAKDRYGFATGFTDQADWLSLQRQTDGSDVGTIKGLYGLP
jgi:hypothetical protein